MCKPASMIVLRDYTIRWSLKTDSHEQIKQEFGLSDASPEIIEGRGVPFVGIEIVPPDGQFDAPLERWQFSVDDGYSSILPEWWNVNLAENAVRAELPKWIAARVVLAGVYREIRDNYVYCLGTVKAFDNATVKAWGNATVEAFDNATVKAWGNATVEAFDNATVEAWDNATVEAWDNATVKAWDNATVEAFDNATVKAWGNATVKALGNATVKARDNATVEALGNATVKARDNATVEALGNATVKAFDNATVKAWGNATVEAFDNATVKARDNATTIISKYHSACFIVQQTSANAVIVDRRQSPPKCIVGVAKA